MIHVFTLFYTISMGGQKVPKKFYENELIEAIDSKLIELTEEEIKMLIEKELSKETDQVDMDYIDLCYDVLEAKHKESAPQKSKTVKLSARRSVRAIFIAAVIVIFSMSTLTASAFVFGIPDMIAQYRNGNAEIDYNLENASTVASGYALTDTDLAKRLAEFGISPVTLPKEMVKSYCKLTKIESRTVYESWANIVFANFDYRGMYVDIRIEQFTKDFGIEAEITVTDIVSAQMVKANGMDILVFEQKNGWCSIIYKDNLTHYDIGLKCDFETAIKIAKSIK